LNWIEDITSQAIADYDRITADPRVRDIDHRIDVCQSWLEQDAETNEHLVDSLTRLRLETNVLEDIVCALDRGKESFRSTHLWRINGEAGEYNDVSGSLLEVCTRWVGTGVLEDFPNFYTIEMADSELTRGNHIITPAEGGITIRIVTKMVEEIPEEEKVDHRNFRYSDSTFAVAELSFTDEAKIRSRMVEAQDEADQIRQSAEYGLYHSTMEEKARLQEARQVLIHQIREETVL